MDPDTVIRIGREALLLALLLSAPAVTAALVVGLVVSLFQASTQIQENTLPMVPKIIAVYVVVAVAGLWMLRHLMQFAVLLFEAIGKV